MKPSHAGVTLWLVATGCLAAGIPEPPAGEACDPTISAGYVVTGWGFRTDPQDIGIADGWSAPSHSLQGWLDLAPGEPWEFSGLEYDGVAWYRTELQIPGWSTAFLGLGSVDDVASLWIDGKQVGSWEDLAGRGVLVDLAPYGNPGATVDLAFRVEDRGGYGGIKQPVRMGPEPWSVLTGGQYLLWLADSHPSWPMPRPEEEPPIAWTMTGRQGAREEALVSSRGAVAPWADAPTVEVWLFDPETGDLAFADQAEIRFSLARGSLPVPEWEWDGLGVTLKAQLLADPRDAAVRLLTALHNPGSATRDLSMLVLVRPFGVNGTMAPICAAGFQGTTRLWINGEPFMIAATPPAMSGVGLLEEAMEAAEGQVPTKAVITNAPAGDAAAIFAYPIRLRPGDSETLHFAFPGAPGADFPSTALNIDTRLEEVLRSWETASQRVRLDLPDDLVERGATASLGYLLVALDPGGPRPGPLAHDAVWVRDAAHIGLALLQFGHADAVRGFIPSMLAAQEEDGRIPPIQGNTIPWDDDEWDSQGQAIFLATSYYRYTRDRSSLRQWYPQLRAAARFLRDLRRSGADQQGPAAGLLPPSKSAEDLGPPEWHHYWDDFWAVAGLTEAAFAADELGENADATWMRAEADALRQAILASITAVMGSDPAYIPGAVESAEGSAMARGSVAALWPVEVLPRDMPLLSRSFDHYHRLWISPHSGGFRHREGQFWPYGGLELAHAYLRLGRTDVLHEILGWTLAHQTLPGTFAWAEQVSPANGGFSGGDMPHAWAAASYATLVREMLFSEIGDAIELFSGVPDWWLGNGEVIAVADAPTHFGALNLRTESTVEQTAGGWQGTVILSAAGASPPGGFLWKLPRRPASVDGPPGTRIEDGRLLIPEAGGTVRIEFAAGSP